MKNSHFNLLILAIGIYGLSCTQLEKYFSNKNLRTVKIDFAEMQLELPANYQLYNVDDLINSILENDTIATMDDPQIVRFEKMKDSDKEFRIYVDTMNIENNIVFVDSEHVRLTKELASYHSREMDKKFIKNYKTQGIKVKRVDNQYLFGRNTQFLKLKYELDYDGLKNYNTQYVISTNTKTMVIFVNGWTTEDFEELFKRVQF